MGAKNKIYHLKEKRIIVATKEIEIHLTLGRMIILISIICTRMNLIIMLLLQDKAFIPKTMKKRKSMR